jgi:hypothetical protein
VTRIVGTAYRYKRPLKRKKPVALEVPAIATIRAHRRTKATETAPAESTAAELSTGNERAGASAAAIVTIRRQGARIIPPGLLADTPEEHQQRGDGADAMWRELVRRINATKRSSNTGAK